MPPFWGSSSTFKEPNLRNLIRSNLVEPSAIKTFFLGRFAKTGIHPFCGSKPPVSHASFGTPGSPVWFQTFADTAGSLVQFQPIMASEIPPEWLRSDPRQEADARANFGESQGGQPVKPVVCVEVPDLQPFWAYAAWSRSRQDSNEVPVMVTAMDSFRGGGDGAQADARSSLRSLISTGKPELFWVKAWVLGDGASDSGTAGRAR